MYGYDEFGNTLVDVPNGAQPFGFTGYQRDDVAGMWYAQARYYAPQHGRFVIEDVVKGVQSHPFTLNAYAYCWNQPLTLVDLDGKWPTLEGFENAVAAADKVVYNWFNNVIDVLDSGNQAINNWLENSANSVEHGTNRVINAMDSWSRNLNHAFMNSLEFQGSYGVGLEGKIRLGPIQGSVGGSLRQTHSYITSSREYTQRNHIAAAMKIDLWRDQIGITPFAISSGYTYSSIDGFIIENGRLIPTFEWDILRFYAGNSSIGWGTDGRDGDWTFGGGLGLYLIVGGDFEIVFNISEFRRQMIALREQADCE